MQLVILATGKCRNKPMLALEEEYYARLPAGWKVSVRELPEHDDPVAEHAGQKAALDKLPLPNVKILLDEKGEQVDSRGLAAKFEKWRGQGVKAVAVVIGGASGVSAPLLEEVDWVLSLGRLTMPHQLVRVVLAEQLYRVQTILSGHPYHRD
ncbi:MAG: 23S rRNA (pseudouridine(1915)-N(3))-methyltransferase RlmH [Proteobacteria bacterium]|nr:23S rRNA (pseudouridine(1915)-N(3))-methyltransferase RlmH [Pseudomonadota bacterium]